MLDLALSLATYIGSNGFGTLASNLFANEVPSDPKTSTAVIRTGGPYIAGDAVRRPTIQILHRNTVASSGTNFVNNLFQLLKDKPNFACDHWVRAFTEPGPYVRDVNNHPVFSLNFVILTTKQL